MCKKLFLSLKNHMLIAFIPWIFFVIFSRHSLMMSGFGSLILMGILNFKELAKGFILPWGSVILFAFLGFNERYGFVELQGIEVFRLINSTLAGIVIVSLILGKPFTLQYAKEEVDQKSWKNPIFLKINWILTGIWAFLMIVMALPSYFLSYEEIEQSWFWHYGLSILCMVIGMQCRRWIPPLFRK